MNKQAILTILFALVAMAGQAQVKCHVEGELRDTTQGVTVIICPADVDIRVSDNYIKAQADAQGRFSCDVETDKMRLYNVFLHEQWKHGSWRNKNFLVENSATVTLCFDDNTWKVVSGGSEQMLKVKMDAEAERLYVSKLNEIETQAEKEIRPRVEELQKQGKNPEEDTLLMKRNREFMADYEKLYNEYRAWEFDYYAAHPMQYALYDKPVHTETAIKEHAIPYPQIINAQGIAASAYHFGAIPHIILFAPDGTILARGLRGKEIDKKLEEIYTDNK